MCMAGNEQEEEESIHEHTSPSKQPSRKLESSVQQVNSDTRHFIIEFNF